MKKDIDSDLKENNTSFIFIAIVVAVVIIGMWIGTIYFLDDWSSEDKSSFGDMFGSINALFSGLALAGIILTILLQRKELTLQRKELQETRAELKRTANAQENSEKALNRQAENLKMSAKLSALNTLVTYYSDLEANVMKGRAYKLNLGQIMEKKENYVQQIEEILERKEEL